MEDKDSRVNVLDKAYEYNMSGVIITNFEHGGSFVNVVLSQLISINNGKIEDNLTLKGNKKDPLIWIPSIFKNTYCFSKFNYEKKFRKI